MIKIFIVAGSIIMLVLEHIVFFGLLKFSFSAYIFFAGIAYVAFFFYLLRKLFTADKIQDELNFSPSALLLFLPLLISPVTALLAYGVVMFVWN